MHWLPGVDETEKYEFAIPLRQNTPHEPKMRKRDRDRAERLRLTGGPKPSLRSELWLWYVSGAKSSRPS